MDSLRDKILGSWFGMAAGDALGLAVRGMKPEAIRQCFREFDGYLDVRPFIGKGIKRYRMRGLYGTQTQCALAVCEAFLKNRKTGIQAVADSLQQLAAGGPETYFGVYRHPDPIFRKSIEHLLSRTHLIPADRNVSSGGTLAMSVPIALLHQTESPALMEQCLETALLMTCNVWEVVGTALTGHLATKFLAVEPGEGSNPPGEQEAAALLDSAADFCDRALAGYRDRVPQLWDEAGAEHRNALGDTLRNLKDKIHLQERELIEWICENASGYLKVEPVHPAQGHALTLLPIALVLVMKEEAGFASAVMRAVKMGREADKLGALVGALAGALYGSSAVPDAWKAELVNGKEIRSRGEALVLRRFPKGLKDLFEMESGLTNKEFEEARQYVRPKQTKTKPRPAVDLSSEGFKDSALPSREDVPARRRYQKDKTRQKRDRRRNLPGEQ